MKNIMEKSSKKCKSALRTRPEDEQRMRIHSVNLPDMVEDIYREEFIQDYRSFSGFVRDMIQKGLDDTCLDYETDDKIDDRGDQDE